MKKERGRRRRGGRKGEEKVLSAYLFQLVWGDKKVGASSPGLAGGQSQAKCSFLHLAKISAAQDKWLALFPGPAQFLDGLETRLVNGYMTFFSQACQTQLFLPPLQ